MRVPGSRKAGRHCPTPETTTRNARAIIEPNKIIIATEGKVNMVRARSSPELPREPGRATSPSVPRVLPEALFFFRQVRQLEVGPEVIEGVGEGELECVFFAREHVV